MVDIYSLYDKFSGPYYSQIKPSDLGKRINHRERAKTERLIHLRSSALIPVTSNNRVSAMRFPSGTLRPVSHQIQSGNLRHAQYQSSVGASSEYPIHIGLLNSKSYIDVFHNRNSLLFDPRVEELKTVDADYIMSMTRPKRSAVSQLNAYLYATGTNQGTLTYLARESPKLKKQFNVNYQPGLLISDIAKQRQAEYYPWASDENYMAATPSPILMHYGAHQAGMRRYKKYISVSPGHNKSRMML